MQDMDDNTVKSPRRTRDNGNSQGDCICMLHILVGYSSHVVHVCRCICLSGRHNSTTNRLLVSSKLILYGLPVSLLPCAQAVSGQSGTKTSSAAAKNQWRVTGKQRSLPPKMVPGQCWDVSQCTLIYRIISTSEPCNGNFRKTKFSQKSQLSKTLCCPCYLLISSV
jgi:hypothetical protein